ncbi:DUF397 domain-containing protein [Streptomyces sp. NPDC003077]|uniref:DUF397 domain-containing protein n=1 Tax=Streptomyces sp. NPDC003077 TaxID=3154443 RepID=UPI0033BD376C
MVQQGWQQSSYCSEGNACVNVSADAEGIYLRESSAPEVTLRAARHPFRVLLLQLKEGVIDG